MKHYITLLIKKNLFLLLSKENNYQFTLKKSIARKGLSGRILQVSLNRNYTKFEVSDYVKVSKKLRSNVVVVAEKDILHYCFVGVCISITKDPLFLNTSFLLRNVFDSFSYEFFCPYHSPIVDSVSVLFYRQKYKYLSHSKYYYLRKKPLPSSIVIFDYVTDIYDHDSIEAKGKEKPLIKSSLRKDFQKYFNNYWNTNKD